MPSRSDLPGHISRRKFLRALKRCGFSIHKTGGKGSHVKVIFTQNQKSITIPKDLRRDVLFYVLKQIEELTPVTWEDIKSYL